MDFVTKSCILYDKQFGFPQKHSTAMALLETVSTAMALLETVSTAMALLETVSTAMALLETVSTAMVLLETVSTAMALLETVSTAMALLETADQISEAMDNNKLQLEYLPTYPRISTLWIIKSYCKNWRIMA